MIVHIFGAGEFGRLLHEVLTEDGRVVVAGFIDSRMSGDVCGLPVRSPQEFVDAQADGMVLIASQSYREMAETMFRLGVKGVANAFPLIALERIRRLQNELEAITDAGRRFEARLAEERRLLGDRGTDLHIARYFLDLKSWQVGGLSAMLFGEPATCPKPPPDIPDNLSAGYSMDGKAIIEYRYIDQTYPANHPRIFTREEMEARLRLIADKQPFAYPGTDEQLWNALERHPVQGMEVAIIGSISPWFESVCLHYGGRPTTIEYNPIISRIPGHRALTPAQWEESGRVFDAAFSISSFEHDGLGGYGDPLDPEADLAAMAKTKRMVKPGGVLFLAVPLGQDKVVFNTHRIYGRARLPLLLRGWTLLDSYGFDDAMLDVPGGAQPVLVLRNDS